MDGARRYMFHAIEYILDSQWSSQSKYHLMLGKD